MCIDTHIYTYMDSHVFVHDYMHQFPHTSSLSFCHSICTHANYIHMFTCIHLILHTLVYMFFAVAILQQQRRSSCPGSEGLGSED